MLCLVLVSFHQYGNAMINYYQSPIPKILCFLYWRFVYFHMICVGLLHYYFCLRIEGSKFFSRFNNNRLLSNHLFNCSIAVFMSFSNSWLSELVIIKLVSSAHSTGLDISDITFGTSLVSSSSSSVICQTTGPKPLPKRFLHIVRSRASSLN
jgi:hypothetical protein